MQIAQKRAFYLLRKGCCRVKQMTDSDERLTPLAHSAQNRCFGCGPANPTGLHLEFLLAADGSIVCLPTVPSAFEGPTGYLHGGIIATLLDETMSKSVRAARTAVTSHLEIEYLRPIPSGTPIRLEGRVVRSEGRRHWTEAKILNGRGTPLAQGKGVFVEVRAR
jgi:uncharacterized protein (TIGR00369 family)